MLKIKKMNIFDLFIYIECFLIIYVSGTAIVTIVGKQSTYQVVTLVMFILAILFIVKVKGIESFLKKMLIYTIALTLIFIINFITYSDSAVTLAYRLTYFLSFLIFTKSVRNHNRDIGIYLYNCIILIAAIALLYYTAIHLLGINLPYSIVYNTNGIKYNMYSYLYLENPESSFVYNFRLNGFFWEPGVFQIYLNYALYRHLFCNNKKNKICLFLIIVNLLLCISTTGYLMAAILIAIKVWQDSKLTKKSKIFLSIPIFIIVLILILYVLAQKKYGLDSDSFDARFSDLLIGFQLFFKNFIFGAGFNNLAIYTEATGRSRGNSNGMIQMMYTLGIVGLSVYVYPFVVNFRKSKDIFQKRKYLTYCLFLIISNMSEPMYIYPFMLLLLCEEYSVISFKDPKGDSE